MIPIIADKNFVRLGALDDFVSFIWTTRYYQCGDFELVLNMSAKALDIVKIGYYVIRDDDENTGIIEKITVDVDADGDERLIASGRFLSSVLARRIIAEQTEFRNQKLSDIINYLINEAVISPDVAARTIPNFTLGSYDIADKLTCQFTGKNLLDVISTLCEEYHVGFKTLRVGAGFQFSLYRGVDRTYNQSTLPYAVFSDTYDNLLSAEYIDSREGFVTDVLVAGEGEGIDRKTAWASKTTNTGLDRYELYKDARNMSSDEGYIPEAEYIASLRQEGMESITEITQAFSGKIDFGNVKYKTDINIGDLCVIEYAKWGLHIDTRLIEVIESVNEQGVYTITPTFGI